MPEAKAHVLSLILYVSRLAICSSGSATVLSLCLQYVHIATVLGPDQNARRAIFLSSMPSDPQVPASSVAPSSLV